MAVARQIVGVRRAHRAEDQLVAHRAAVDEEILPERIGAGEGRRGGETFDHDTVALGADLDGAAAEVRSQDIAEPCQPAGRAGQRRRPGHGCALFAGECERNVGPRHGEAPHHLADRFGLGAVGLEEFQPRRRCIKEIADLDAGAMAERGRHDPGLHAALDRKRPGVRLTGVARGDAELGHRADRGQRLAAEAQRADAQEILVVELGGGVALDRQREVACVMPPPSSVMPMRRLPPPSVKMSMRLAPASIAFSTSSFTTLAGRSTTSPAAMRLTICSGSWRTGMAVI